MFGTKKLSTIREELWSWLGDDAIGQLDRMIAEDKREGRRTDLTEGLKEFLQSRPKPKTKERVVSAKRKKEREKIEAELEQFIQAAQKELSMKNASKHGAETRTGGSIERHKGRTGAKSPCGRKAE